MSHISDFKNFKLMLENNNVNHMSSTRIFEDIQGSIESAAPGAKIVSLGLYTGNVFPEKEKPNLYTTARKTFGPTAMPEMHASGQSINNDSEFSGLLNLFLRGIRQITGTDKLGGSGSGDIDVDKAEEIVNSLNIKSTKVGNVKTIMEKHADASGKVTGTYVQSVGTVKKKYIDKAGNKKGLSSFNQLQDYLNTFNIQNWAAGDFTQYNPNKMLNDMNRVDLTKDSAAIMDNNNQFMYMITPGEFVQTKGSREEENVTVQGQGAQEGVAVNDFVTMKFESKPTDKTVIDIGNKILGYLGDKKAIKKITLTSSASPIWKGKNTALSNGTGDPSGGKLKNNTFANEASELGNQYLAYLRGLSFRNALKKYLGDAYPDGSETVINWKVSSDEPGAGKHFKYRVETAAEAPKVIQRTNFYKGESSVKKGDFEYVIYKVSYDRSALGTESKGVLGLGSKADYSALKVGDQIKILTKGGKKAQGSYRISKIEDNRVYIRHQGEDKEIPAKRYVKRVSTKEEKDEI